MAKKPPAGRLDQTEAPTVVALDALQEDESNRRRRTARGAAMLVDSLQDVGAARSIVIDEDNVVLAGNGVVEAAAKAGITKVRIVEAAGDELIAVKRTGLSEDKKRRLAMYDNRTGELAEWDLDQLAADHAAGLELDAFFDQNEIAGMLEDRAPSRQAVVEEVDTTLVADTFWISVRGPLPQQAFALRKLQELMKELDGVSVEIGTVAQAPEDA